MNEYTIWLKVSQNLKSLEIEQKWLVSSYGKNLWREFLFCAFIFIVLFFLNLRKQFFRSKLIILVLYNDIVWLFICCKTKLKIKKIYICFWQNIPYLQEKMFLYGKKLYIEKMFLYGKKFYIEKMFYWKKHLLLRKNRWKCFWLEKYIC